MKIEDIIQTDPLFHNQKLTHAPLNGGFSNETHLVTCDGQNYVVKINYEQNEYLHLTRKTELQAQSIAASMGIAPRVLSDCNVKDYSISEFIEGQLITGDEILQEDNLSQFSTILRNIHSIKGVDRTCSAFDLIDGYVQGIAKFKVKEPDGYTDILKMTEKIRDLRNKDKANNHKYCHNDLLTLNLLYKEPKITVIDWEISGMGDPYMDLATLPYSNRFSEEKERFLLSSYFGYYEDEMLMILSNMKYIGMVREVVWALFHEGLHQKSINHDINYYETACYSLDRIKKGYNTLW